VLVGVRARVERNEVRPSNAQLSLRCNCTQHAPSTPTSLNGRAEPRFVNLTRILEDERTGLKRRYSGGTFDVSLLARGSVNSQLRTGVVTRLARARNSSGKQIQVR
jgi:hypothetical protein